MWCDPFYQLVNQTSGWSYSTPHVWTRTNINNTLSAAASITCAPSQARDLRKNASLSVDEASLPAILWVSASAAAGVLDLHNMCAACTVRGERLNIIALIEHQWKCPEPSCLNGTVEFKRGSESGKVQRHLAFLSATILGPPHSR